MKLISCMTVNAVNNEDANHVMLESECECC